jgi:hypothetical protein
VSKTVVLVDRERNVPWEYEIDDEEEYAFLLQKGELNDLGHIVLSMPLIAAVQRFSLDGSLQKVKSKLDSMRIPELTMDQEIVDVDLGDLHNCTNAQLEEKLTLFGGYKSYLETELSKVASEKGLCEAAFDAGMQKAQFALEQKYKRDNARKPNKEILRGEVLTAFPILRNTYQRLIECEALYTRLEGVKNGYASAYSTASRIVSLRTMREQV